MNIKYRILEWIFRLTYKIYFHISKIEDKIHLVIIWKNPTLSDSVN